MRTVNLEAPTDVHTRTVKTSPSRSRHVETEKTMSTSLARVARGVGRTVRSFFTTETQKSRVAKPFFNPELFRARSEVDKLGGNNRQAHEMSTPHYLPLLTAEEVKQWSGLSLGALKVIIMPPGDTQPVLCFEKRVRNDKGRMETQYRVLTDEQLSQMKSAKYTGYPDPEVLDAQLLKLSEGDRRIIGQDSVMPGVAVKKNEMLLNEKDDYGPGVKGNVELYNGGGNLVIRDLYSKEGTYVQYNPQHVPAQDPWASHPIGHVPVYPY